MRLKITNETIKAIHKLLGIKSIIALTILCMTSTFYIQLSGSPVLGSIGPKSIGSGELGLTP